MAAVAPQSLSRFRHRAMEAYIQWLIQGCLPWRDFDEADAALCSSHADLWSPVGGVVVEQQCASPPAFAGERDRKEKEVKFSNANSCLPNSRDASEPKPVI